jgi:hypothetical protein
MDDPVKGCGPVHQIILVGPVRIALPVGIVLIDDEATAVGDC